MFRKALTIESYWLKFDIRTERPTIPAKMNEAEFENFYNEYSRPLWGYVRRIAGGAEIADDIVQESFMRFLGAAQRAEANPKAYLYRIATNLVYDHFRSHARHVKRQSAAPPEEAFYEPFAAENEMTKVFDRLKPQERALLWLAYVEGHQHAEIAEMLGLKSLSVRVLLFRARRKLANLLSAENCEVKN